MKHLLTVFSLFFMLSPALLSAREQTRHSLDLIPKPQKVEIGEGVFKLNSTTAIVSDDSFNAKYLADILNGSTGLGIREGGNKEESNTITLSINPESDIPQEGYLLSVTPEKIVVESSTSKGSFYAIQTLLQLLPPSVYGNPTGDEKWEVPCVRIEDSPRFPHRGLMMDVSRTFFSLDYIYRFLDWMAYHKLNVFQWHITDDNGWRIEIKKYPELTEKGAWRGPGEVLPSAYGSGNKRYGGFYTQKEIKEVIEYAAKRNIEIIPEIDMPGHSKAVISTYPQTGCDNKTHFISINGEVKNVWCVGNEDNYKMLDNIIKEVAALFPSKIIHVGGDEVNMDNWKECSKCRALMKKMKMENPAELQNYFMQKVEAIINKYGKTMAGWDEILDGGTLDPSTRIYSWRSVNKPLEAVERGHQTVLQLSEYYYFDMKQSPAERGHNWAAIIPIERVYSLDPVESCNIPENRKELVLGAQGALWAELLNKPSRFSEYQYYPRTCALAETVWTNQELRDFNDFQTRLEKTHFERLFHMGIAFRVEAPGVTYKGNRLVVTLPYDWAVVRYTTDGSEPSCTSNIYTGDIVTFEPEKFRFATFYKDLFKSITVTADNIVPNYIKPETVIETSFGEQRSFPKSNITDYNFNTYWRTERTGVEGDYVTYLFKEPVKCSRITVNTSIPDIDLYGVTDGYVEYTYNGTDWIRGDDFADNSAVIVPQEGKEIKGVKIVFTDTTDALCVALQDLKIE